MSRRGDDESYREKRVAELRSSAIQINSKKCLTCRDQGGGGGQTRKRETGVRGKTGYNIEPRTGTYELKSAKPKSVKLNLTKQFAVPLRYGVCKDIELSMGLS